MIDGAVVHVIANGRMSAVQDFVGEEIGAFPTAGANEAKKLSLDEVPGIRRNDVEKARLTFGVAEFGKSFDMVKREVHRLMICATNSLSSITRRRFDSSSARAYMEKPAATFCTRFRNL